MTDQSKDPVAPITTAFDTPAIAAKAYLKFGWEPVVLRVRSKKPQAKWKEPWPWKEEEIDRKIGSVYNLGIALGERSNDLLDIDCDSQEVARIADLILADLPSFGRASSPSSHRMAYGKIKKGRVVYQIPADIAKKIGVERSVLLEVRGTGHLTMVPPSTHPSGEEVRWEGQPDQIPAVDPTDLARRCGLSAALGVVLNRYPRVEGDRDNICLALTGTLVRCGLTNEEIDRIVGEIARLAEDEEAEQRGTKAAATRARIEAGEPVWGLPELCVRLDISELEPTLRKWLGITPDGWHGAPGQQIVVRAGHIPEEVDQAERALLTAELGVYQRGEHLVRASRLPQSVGEEGIIRPGGALLITRITSPWLREKFALSATWVRHGEDGYKRIDPPASHASAYLARVGEWKAPVLHGVSSSPTMRKDGTILQEPGYDVSSGILFEPNGIEFPPIPVAPSRDDAKAALRILHEPFRDFAFATPADASVLLSAVITSLVRRSLPSAPLFAIDAPTAGSGKSLLTETVGIIATGHKPTMISQGKSAEEDEKRLATVLMAGDAVLTIDNCDRPLAGDTLCTTLTQEFIAARILGKSELSRMPTNILIMATGNNLEVVGDLSRRTLICRLDTGEERPDLIEYDFDPREEALARRPELVAAGLTILRAYIAAGRPTQASAIGSFERWNVVREALIWLGAADPADTRERVISDDPRKGELAELLVLWVEALDDATVTLSELDHRADDVRSSSVSKLRDELAAKTRHGHFNARSVGRYLAKHKDRVVGGLVLRCEDDPSGSKRYRVESIPMPKHGQAGEGSSTPDIPF